MRLLRSAKDGYVTLGLKGLLRGLLWAWLLPSLLAAVALVAQNLVGSQTWGDGALMIWAGSYLVLISPAISWLGLVLVAPFIAVLMDRGWFGWGTALMIGVAAGAAIGAWIGLTLAIPFGGLQFLALRAVLGRISPKAFAV